MHDDNFLNRRAAFWDNWRSSFEHAIKQFEADSAGKFIDSYDKKEISAIKQFLNAAYVQALKRYHKVLGEQIYAIDMGAENDPE